MASLSPTGIPTKAFVWIRPFQLFFAASNFIVGLIETVRIPLILGFFFPITLLTVLVTIETSKYYKKRYAQGAGWKSTRRWIADLLTLVLLGTSILVILISDWWAEGSDAERFGPYHFEFMFSMIYLTFTGVNGCLFLATFIMLCVEHDRMRKRGPTTLPSATEAMPTSGEPLYRYPAQDLSASGQVDVLTATKLVNAMVANGYTLEQLEKISTEPPKGSLGRKASIPPSYRE